LGKAQANNITGEVVIICYRQSIRHTESFTTTSLLSMDSYSQTGFYDCESCYINTNFNYVIKYCKTDLWVIPTFTIEQPKKSASILYKIKAYFRVVSLNIRISNVQLNYTLASVKDLKDVKDVKDVKDLMEVKIPHFSKYPLLQIFLFLFLFLFKSAVELINTNKHLTIGGLIEIVSKRVAINLGLTETHIASFPDITPKDRAKKYGNINIPSPYLFTEYIEAAEAAEAYEVAEAVEATEAAGCFFLFVPKSKSYNVFYQTQLLLSLVPHKRSEKLIESFLSYFDSVKLQIWYNKTSVCFFSYKTGRLGKKIIPFFKKYSLLGSTNKEFIYFSSVLFLVKSKSPLIEEGLNQILDIKFGITSCHSRFLVKRSPIIQKREFHHKVKAKNRIGPHNIDTLSIILGSLLGNGKMTKLVEGSKLEVRVTNKEYALWFYKFFYNRGYTSNLQPRQYTNTLRSKEGTEYYGYEFNTFTFRSFNWIHRMFYNKGRKVIPGNIYEYLTPLALAVWIMDDESISNFGIRLATNSLKIKELKLLQEVLKTKYNLETTIQNIYIKDQYTIYIQIKKKSVNNLRNIVGPYIHFCMLHKLG